MYFPRPETPGDIIRRNGQSIAAGLIIGVCVVVGIKYIAVLIMTLAICVGS